MLEEDKFKILGVGNKEYLSQLERLVTEWGYDFKGFSTKIITPEDRLLMAIFGLPSYDKIINSDCIIADKSVTSLGISSLSAGFLPLIILTKKRDECFAFRAGQKGAADYISMNSPGWEKKLEERLSDILQYEKNVGKLKVVKFGGSADDRDEQTPRYFKNLYHAAVILSGLHKEGKRMICMVGGGQDAERAKKFMKKYGHQRKVRNQFPMWMMTALRSHAERVLTLFEDVFAYYSKPEEFFYINKNTLKKGIPFMTLAPPCILRKYGIPLQDSDTHTLGTANFYAAEAIYLKRTDRAYKFDPYRGFRLNRRTGRCANYDAWRKAQEKNKVYDGEVTVDQLLSISREGTNVDDGKPDKSQGHLIEDSALKYYRDYCKRVKEILIVHIAAEEMYRPIKDGWGEHIVTGEKIEMPDIKDNPAYWGFVYSLLRKSLTNAFNGIANSKIVRN